MDFEHQQMPNQMPNQMPMQPPPPSQTHPFQSNFWGCFGDMGVCCLTCWCPCVTYAHTGERLKSRNDLNAPGFCSGPCWLWCGLACVTGGIGPSVLQLIRRGDLRERLRIEGNGGIDCLAAFCCPCCDLIQSEREVKKWQEGKDVYASLPAEQPGHFEQMYYPQKA